MTFDSKELGAAGEESITGHQAWRQVFHLFGAPAELKRERPHASIWNGPRSSEIRPLSEPGLPGLDNRAHRRAQMGKPEFSPCHLIDRIYGCYGNVR
jgi:hypothetical protein